MVREQNKNILSKNGLPLREVGVDYVMLLNFIDLTSHLSTH